MTDQSVLAQTSAQYLPPNRAWHSTCALILNSATAGLLPATAVVSAYAAMIHGQISDQTPLHEMLDWLVRLSTLTDPSLPCVQQLALSVLDSLAGLSAPRSSRADLSEGAQLPKGVKVGDVPKSKWSHTNADWFDELDTYFKMHGPVVNNEHKLYLAVHASTQSRALHSRLKLIQSTTPSKDWEGVKKEIKETMYEKDSAKTARDKLAALLQGRMSAEEYVTKFETHCFEAGDVSEAEKCDRFMRQMDPNLQKEISKAGDPKTYEEMRAAATRIDGQRRNPHFGKNIPRDFSSRKDTFYYKGSRDPHASSSSSASRTANDGPQPMDLNHTSSRKPMPVPQHPRLTEEEKKMYDEKGWCKYCRSKNHTVADCKIKPSRPFPPKGKGSRQR